jgi:asparagine synthase (glutamine-hydrolysing)
MCRRLAHRGPDDQGVYLDDGFGMGIRRLKIIDLVTGRQPIRNEDGTVWTVFNGEIYNYLELRRALQDVGHVFYTNTDTEVIVHLYEDHGERFVERLAGMFAIALWDSRRQTLILARDRLGIKPLYYLVDGRRVLFASEIKAILEAGVPREVDPQALHDYLSFNYVPGPRTIFRDIRKLPPGTLMVCTRRGIAQRGYWHLDYPGDGDNGPTRSEESYADELHVLLKTAVRQHLLSDVPLGVFLSGGVDSSSLVALMREVSGEPIQTFSIGFPEPSYDELVSARTVARTFGTQHHELVVRPDAATLLPRLIRFFDEPFADSSAIPVHCVSQLARQHVTVALTGEGGDEIFAGYETYAAHKLAALYRRLPRFVAATIVPAGIKRLPTSHRRVSFDYKAKRFVDGALLPPPDGHYWWKVIFTEEAKAALYAEPPGAVEDPIRFYREAYEQCEASNPLTRLQHIDLTIYLPDDLLVKADRMSMAHSLEARVPFLDHRVVEFTAALPAHLKIRGLTKKYILKRTMARHLPSTILRARKRGFNVPMPAWLVGDLREFVHDTLSETRVRRAGFFRPAAVSALLQAHEARRADLSRNIFGLLVFTHWCDEYLRAPSTGEVSSGVLALTPPGAGPER